MEYKIVGDKELQIYLNKMIKGMRNEINKGMDEIGRHLKKEVKSKFGKYQQGWAKLKRATVVAKYKRRKLAGYKHKRSKLSSLASMFNFGIGPDDPLSLFGDLEKSIYHKNNKSNLSTTVYSDDEKAAVHEYGYAPKNIPARSYMRLTLFQEEDYVVKILSNRVGNLI